MLQHQLVKIEAGYKCNICKKQWQRHPRASCIGVPTYHMGNRPDNLLLESELTRKNFKPGNNPVGYIEDKKLYLYKLEEAAIANPNLPQIYTWDNRPAHLKTPNQLNRYNRTPSDANPQGCIWDSNNAEWVFLYAPEECAIADPNLPTCYEYSQVPPELKTKGQLKKMHLSVEGKNPSACYRFWDKEEEYWVTVLLWHPEDCEWKVPDNYLTKTTLKHTYLLSDGWIKKLGEADLIRENPHHFKFAPMHLYSRQRVEKFLADNAENYAKWLDERDRYIAIFEQNREAILLAQRSAIAAGKARVKEEKQKQKQLLREQTARCLKCVYGAAFSGGFLCAVYPSGLELYQIPCQDWTERN